MKNFLRYSVVFGVFTAMFISGAHAGYLHWMIAPGSIATGTEYAKLRVEGPSGSSTYLADADGYYDYLPFEDGSWSDSRGVGVLQWSVISSEMLKSDYKFIIELYNLSGDQLSVFNAYYGDVIASSQAYSPGSGPDSVGYYVFENQNIPEPTSGMLMLFGLGLLALRRKQKKA